MKQNCSNHKKEVAGVSDMEALGKMIGELHYKTLHDLLIELQCKLIKDSIKDEKGGRNMLAHHLSECASFIGEAAEEMKTVWRISKPHMKKE